MLEGIAGNQDRSDWKIVRVAPKSERIAVQELATNGFESYFPRVIVGDPHRSNYTPLFPGYIFTRKICDFNNSLPLYMLPHVYGWVVFDGHSPSIPQHVIDELQCRVSDINSDGGLWHKYEIGDLVKITLCGVDSLATVIKAPRSPEKPIDILLDFMGRKVPAQVTIDKVNPVQYPIHHSNNISRRSRGRGRLTRQYREYQKINAEILQ